MHHICANGDIVVQHLIVEHTQTIAFMPWIIAGDLNTDEGDLMVWCQPFAQSNVPCVPTSLLPNIIGAHKADLALPQGIDLVPVTSVVGWHSRPCASDVHDAAVVTGPFLLR